MAKGPRRDRSREQFWRKTLADFEASGLSIRGFCRAHDLHESAFYFWRRELTRRDRRSAKRTASSKPMFVPIRVVASQPLEVVLRSGHVVRVAAGFEASHLQAVVAALEGRSC
jgi:transposase-like protein